MGAWSPPCKNLVGDLSPARPQATERRAGAAARHTHFFSNNAAQHVDGAARTLDGRRRARVVPALPAELRRRRERQPRGHLRAAAVMQFGFKVEKSERLLIREAWERADAYRPGKPNWFTQQPKDIVELHKALLPEIEASPSTAPGELPGCGNVTSLLGALLKSLTTGDLALTLCSKEPPVLTELRDWLVEALTMPEAVCGLPEEQGRVLATLAKALDARKMLDLGTFTGYSSIAMALATADDAKVIACEPDKKYADDARDWWLKAGCSGKMEMHDDKDAETLMKQLLEDPAARGSFDMIFVDAGERERYGAIHELAMELVHVGGVVVYYDTLWPADEVLQTVLPRDARLQPQARDRPARALLARAALVRHHDRLQGDGPRRPRARGGARRDGRRPGRRRDACRPSAAQGAGASGARRIAVRRARGELRPDGMRPFASNSRHAAALCMRGSDVRA